jgi:hypothetical protein
MAEDLPQRARMLMSSVDQEYGGKYADTMEGEWLVLMRKVLEGEITDKDSVAAIKKGFNNEFGEEALPALEADIAAAKK